MMNPDMNSAITDLVLGKLHPEEAECLLDRISRDPELSESLEVAIVLHSYSQGIGKSVYERRIVPEKGLVARGAVVSVRGVTFSDWRRRIAVIAVAVTSIAIIVLNHSAMTMRDTLDEPEASWISWTSQRSSAHTDLVHAEMLMRNGEHASALRILLRYLRAHPTDALHRQVQYNAAVLQLFLSRDEVLGVWVGNDSAEVCTGLQMLDSVVSDFNPVALRDRARFLRGRAMVAIGNDAEAIKELGRLVDSESELNERAMEVMKTVIIK